MSVLPKPVANSVRKTPADTRGEVLTICARCFGQGFFTHCYHLISILLRLFIGEYIVVLFCCQCGFFSICLHEGFAFRDGGLGQGESLAQEKIELKTIVVASICLLDGCRVEAALSNHHLVRDLIHAGLRDQSLNDYLSVRVLWEVIDEDRAVVSLDF